MKDNFSQWHIMVEKYKSIIFDFDGVILESVDIKTRAFREMFKGYPDYLESILEYHHRNGGVSRFRKFAYIYEYILHISFSEEKSRELGETFSSLIFEEIKKCQFVSGVEKFLQEISKQKKIFIASGTPEEEMRRIVEMRGISKYFFKVYGSPKTKSEIIDRISQEEEIEKKDILFIGDTPTDYEESQKAGVAFAARIKDGEDVFFRDINVPKFSSFYEFEI